ncbi:MAG TPA: HAD-IA family hydrolase [Pirellulales bacterium]|nr:HAD-IA family hydrolase [Pirellulales bacterium]
MRVRAVLFDAVGTLIFPDPPVVAAYAAAAERFGVHLDEVEITTRFREAFAEREEVDRRNGYRTGPTWERYRWLRIVNGVFCDAAPPETCNQIFGELFLHFARPASWRVDPVAAPCWQALADRGLIVGVASNFDDRLTGIARQLPPLDRAARLYISAQIGYRKPAAEFFRAIERDLGIEAAELLSIGDDLENDYRGANSAGWRAILIDSSPSRPELPRCDVITSLRELPERLDQLR